MKLQEGVKHLIKGSIPQNWVRRRLSGDKRQIALTFDDGPHPQHTPALLEVLARHQVPATFFCVGYAVEKHPAIVKQMEAAGHEVANHGFRHEDANTLHSFSAVHNEIQRANDLLNSLMKKSLRYYRPPHGILSLRMLSYCRYQQIPIVLWSNDSMDYLIGSRFKTQPKSMQQLRSEIKSGEIILFHDDNDHAARLLDQLIPQLRQDGYSFVTVSQGLSRDPIRDL